MAPNAKDKAAAPCITDGLIIRTFNGVGEADRFVTVLTRDKGVIRAAARGARRVKYRAGSATERLCYYRLRLLRGRDTYIVEDAQPIAVFFGLRADIEKTALAQYFCELAAALCPTEEPAEEPLRLLLNALHLLADGSRPPTLLKAAVEWRLLSLAGYMPDMSGCAVCGGNAATMLFSAVDGRLYCPQCDRGNLLALPAGATAAIRHLLTCPLEKCFAFSLAPDTLRVFSAVAETFLKAQLGRSFKTLDFYHQLGVNNL